MIDAIEFLDFCGAINNGYISDATIPMFMEKILEIGEISDSVEKVSRLDAILPVYPSGEQHPLYWICLMWLESMGLIERNECEGGLAEFELCEAGVYVLRSLRERRQAYS